MDRVRDEERNEDLDVNNSSRPTDVRSSVTSSILSPNRAGVSRWRAGLGNGQGTAAATSLRDAATEEVPSLSVHSGPGTPEGGHMPTPSAVLARVNMSWGTASADASVRSSQVVLEEDGADDSPSSRLEGRWVGANPIALQGWTRGEQKRLDLDSVTLFIEDVLATKRSGNGCQCPPCTTVLLLESMVCIVCAVFLWAPEHLCDHGLDL